MKIVLINASPKGKNSASASLLETLIPRLPEGAQTLFLPAAKLPSGTAESLSQADAIVVACPLYVDGLPGHLLSCLMELENGPWKEGARVYGIVNCGFYEGAQNRLALRLLENWCAKAGLAWGGGLGVGGGGALDMLPQGEKGPRAPINREVGILADAIRQLEAVENRYATVAFPRALYRLSGQFGWRKRIKANGGKAKDLGKQW